MTTPSATFPHTLAEDEDGDRLSLHEMPHTGRTYVQAYGNVGDRQVNVYVDPADLIRELSPFVPIPAEARKVITDWLAHSEDASPIAERHADDLLATLAAEGLLVGPGEPAGSFHEEVMLDARRQAEERVRELEAENNRLKDALSTNSDDALCICITGGPAMEGPDEYCLTHGRTKAEWMDLLDAARSRLNELDPDPFMDPPVTAEPATAPSVEQIAEVDHAGQIRPVYGTPGGAAAAEDLVRGLERDRDWYRNQRNQLSNDLSQVKGDARKFEALAKEAMTNRDQALAALSRLETEVEEHREYAAMVNREVGTGDTLQGIRNLRAALEAAENLAAARYTAEQLMKQQERSTAARVEADANYERAAATFHAARAAVEADTTEEA